jgi:hypothetical protein
MMKRLINQSILALSKLSLGIPNLHPRDTDLLRMTYKQPSLFLFNRHILGCISGFRLEEEKNEVR